MTELSSDQKKQSLRISLFLGMSGCLTTSFSQEFFTPFILFLGAQARHVGILNASINMLPAFIQLVSAEIVEKLKSRRKMINLFLIVQVIALAFIVLLALTQRMNYWLFILLAALFIAAGTVSHPAWLSLLSDLVEQDKRGDYFGWRSRILGLISVGAMMLAGWLLSIFAKFNTLYGFCIMFTAALICRTSSLWFLHKMAEPSETYSREHHFTFIQFFRRLKESNFAKFVLFIAAMNFSVNLAAPYFAVFMLKDLSFNYLLYSGIMIVAPLTVYLTIRRWGQHADMAGNLKVIKLTTRLIAFNPILWIINQSPVYLIAVECFAGFLWAGFSLCSANFVYDAVRPQKRTRCIAYFSVVNGLALSAGALLGGFIIHYLPPLFGYKLLMLFLISACLRLMVSLFLPQIVKEVRPVHPVNSAQLFFSMIRMRPILGNDRQTTRIQE